MWYTAVEGAANPAAILADDSPRRLFAHEARDTVERDLCPIGETPLAVPDGLSVPVDQRALHPCGRATRPSHSRRQLAHRHQATLGYVRAALEIQILREAIQKTSV